MKKMKELNKSRHQSVHLNLVIGNDELKEHF